VYNLLVTSCDFPGYFNVINHALVQTIQAREKRRTSFTCFSCIYYVVSILMTDTRWYLISERMGRRVICKATITLALCTAEGN